MKPLQIVPFQLIFLMLVKTTLTTAISPNGTWNYIWQNNPNDLCVPQTITITTTSENQGIVEYDYDWRLRIKSCPSDLPYPVSWNITYSSETKLWNDTKGQQILYDSTANTIKFLTEGGIPFWYTSNDISGAERSNKTIRMTPLSLTGLWDLNYQLEIDTENNCCHPDILYITYFDKEVMRSNPIFSYSAYYTTQSNCFKNITNQVLHILDSNLTTLNLVDDLLAPRMNLSLTGSTLTLLSGMDNSCSSIYTKSTNFTAINGGWKEDWQNFKYEQSSNQDSEFPPYYGFDGRSPKDYWIRSKPYDDIFYYELEVIDSNDNPLMVSHYLNGCIMTSNFIIQDLEGNYYDTSLNKTFSYDKTTNTIQFIDDENRFFYSNGSLFNASSFVGVWGNPQVIESLGDCWIPEYLSITENPNITEKFPMQFGGSMTRDISPNTLKIAYMTPGYGEIQSNLSILRPSIVQLTWVDGFNTTISFADVTSSSKILVNLNNQCSFTMVPVTWEEWMLANLKDIIIFLYNIIRWI